MTKTNSLILLMAVTLGLPVMAAPSEVLMVVMGGYTSCRDRVGAKPYGIGMYPGAQALMKKIKSVSKDTKVSYIITCLYSDPPPSGRMEIVTSEAPDKSHKGNGADLMNEIEAMEAKAENPVTFVVGHSYGGWLAMYLGERLKLTNGITGLVTVDPISTECGPMGVIFGSKECHQAPEDCNNKQIQENTGEWLNFYQTADSHLTSSKIAEATKNFHITYRGPHTSIDADARTWKEIETSVLATLR